MRDSMRIPFDQTFFALLNKKLRGGLGLLRAENKLVILVSPSILLADATPSNFLGENFPVKPFRNDILALSCCPRCRVWKNGISSYKSNFIFSAPLRIRMIFFPLFYVSIREPESAVWLGYFCFINKSTWLTRFRASEAHRKLTARTNSRSKRSRIVKRKLRACGNDDVP